MRIIPVPVGSQLHLIVDNPASNQLRSLYEDSTPDEVASVLTFARGRVVEPHEIHSVFDGPGAA